MNKGFYSIIGLMSGTSLDGLDIAHCEFKKLGENWSYQITHCTTINYSEEWKQKLSNLSGKSALEFFKTHVEYGHYLGIETNKFINKHHLAIDAIASHGHTIFHQPKDGFTCQIGDGAAISAETKKVVISDFRSVDVALSGQGAPLVPIGDKLLFKEFDFCLNLGGFANISFDEKDSRVAFDICPVNIVLNVLANKMNQAYDKDGNIARKGNICKLLLTKLNNIDFYNFNGPKSLGKEWVETVIFPILNNFNIATEDLIATFTEHIANQIANTLNKSEKKQVLVTGGGAYNVFLIERIKSLTKHRIVIPSENIIEYKEALIFAFLGLLRLENEINCLSSVTGANVSNCGGSIYNAIGIKNN